MEQWELKEIRRLEAQGHANEERIRKLEWRERERIHLNLFVLYWIILAAALPLEIAVTAIKG
jgi:hypothetical protein